MADANGDVDWGNVQGPTAVFPSAAASRRSDAAFSPLFRRFFDFSLIFSTFLRYRRTSGDEIRRANSPLTFPRSRRRRKAVGVTRAPPKRRPTDAQREKEVKAGVPTPNRCQKQRQNPFRLREYRGGYPLKKCKTDRRDELGGNARLRCDFACPGRAASDGF